jgi:prefoldin subunit 4
MIAKEDENDNEVRREDQDRINQFARLNARLQEIKFEREQIKVSTLTIAHTLTCVNNHE